MGDISGVKNLASRSARRTHDLVGWVTGVTGGVRNVSRCTPDIIRCVSRVAGCAPGVTRGVFGVVGCVSGVDRWMIFSDLRYFPLFAAFPTVHLNKTQINNQK
jgi:hypothetical protein